MPGDVDDVVDARHYEHVAVLVHEACITRAVVSRELLEIGRAKALLSIPQGRKRSGRKRQLAAERADVAGLHLVAIGTGRTNVHPGTALVGEPGFTANGLPSPASSPIQFATIGQPVSVCHQWSITGTPSLLSAHFSVSGSQRSPARKSVRNFVISYLRMNSPLGSSRLMARKAVGAVKSARTPCCEMILQ